MAVQCPKQVRANMVLDIFVLAEVGISPHDIVVNFGLDRRRVDGAIDVLLERGLIEPIDERNYVPTQPGIRLAANLEGGDANA